MPHEANGTGKGGKSFQDRELASQVRRLTLEQIKAILERPKMDRLKQAVILKLAATILPRLNEHSGEDGGPINVTITKYGDSPAVPVSTPPVSA